MTVELKSVFQLGILSIMQNYLGESLKNSVQVKKGVRETSQFFK